MLYYVKMSSRIYNNKNFSAYRRSLVFIIRSLMNYQKMQELRSFIEESMLRNDIAAKHPGIFEQVTRCIFYRGSSFNERLKLIKDHLTFCEKRFTKTALKQIYFGQGITLWDSNFNDGCISLELYLCDIHYREGCLALGLKIGENMVYTVIFWIEFARNGEPVLKIGALQGIKEGLLINRQITKVLFGFRPQNFILYGLQTIAVQLGISRIYAVSDYGHYAKNHIRLNRKLKTSLDKLWYEAGAKNLEDRRFFEVPLKQVRKRIDDVVSHKRNFYRKRYALLDEIALIIKDSLGKYMDSTEKVAGLMQTSQLDEAKFVEVEDLAAEHLPDDKDTETETGCFS